MDETPAAVGGMLDAALARLPWLAPLGVALLTAAAYANAAPAAAVHDDKFFVPNVFQLNAGGLKRIFSEDPWGATGAPAGRYRPLLLLTFALDSALFGNDLRGYHLTNIVVHVATTVTLYFVLAALLKKRASVPAPRLAAAVAAAVFGVHPIHTEAVDSVFNGSEMFVALGVLVSFAALVRWEEHHPRRAWTAVGATYLAALLFRENAAVLPALAVALVWLLHPGEDAARRVRHVLPAVSLAIPLGAYLLLRSIALAQVVASAAPSLAENLAVDDTLTGRLALFATTMREYLRMMVWPHPLRASYENFAPSAVALAVLLQVGVIATALSTWRRAPWLAFGLVFFYVALLPSTRLLTAASQGSGLLAQPAAGLILVAERTTYMPSLGLAFPLAFGLAALVRREGDVAVLACGACLIGTLALITYGRNADWHSDRTLWEAETRADPTNGDALRLLTGAYLDLHRPSDTARICDRELQRHPRLAQLANNCAIAYQRTGRPSDAEAAYRRVIDLGLASVGHANLARLLDQLGRTAEAEQEYQRAIDAEVEPGRKHFRRGQWLLRFHRDRLEDAETEFEQALDILPDWAQAKTALAEVKALRSRSR